MQRAGVQHASIERTQTADRGVSKLLPSTPSRLLSKKNELSVSKIETLSVLSPALGESLLALQRFALTTNNITYAAFGESMRYWDFFPTGQPDWGHMPVWGIARVVESTVAGVETGQRYFGYYPIAEHFVCKPHRVSKRGFADSTDYRQALPSAYNYYSQLGSEDASLGQRENYEMLIRPLFLTSYLLADYLRDRGYFGAERIVVSSASSKTAYGSAYCLSESGIPLIGLTSPRNLSFVNRMRCFSTVVPYDDLETIDNDAPTLYVDFQGEVALRKRVHRHFSQLKHDCYAGSAASLEPLRQDSSLQVETKFFFAAKHIHKLNQEIGAAEVNQRMSKAQDQFIDKISNSDDPWLRIVENVGIESAQQLIHSLCTNQVAADEGHIVTLSR